ncbi:hypothetical protein [Marinoscillum pacificum]|uniref:hypothetical protein n=1 Tax=Marinoscillum pacificum TaxID=392723 RepID=UPI0021581F9A|nr:hypothetical protein [Marinoscillum pacificum]
MIDPMLQMYLMANVFVVVVILLFWRVFRRVISISSSKHVDEKMGYQRVKRIRSVYWVIFFLFVFMVVVYSVLPDLYFLFFPLDLFHHPLINGIGILIIKLAIVVIIVAQLHIDKELFKYSRNIESLAVMELVYYSERMLLVGMLFFFLGVAITITNIIGLVLTASSGIFYLKTDLHKHSS